MTDNEGACTLSERKKGSTGVTLEFRLADATTGAAISGVDVTTLKLQYKQPGAAPSTATSLTLKATFATAWAAYAAKEADATNSKGVYDIDVPDAAFAAGGDEVAISISGTAIETSTRLIDLMAADMRDGVRLGLTALPNVASGSAGAIVTSGTGTAQLSTSTGRVDVGNFLGHAVVLDANFYPAVNIVDVAGSAASVVTGGINSNLISVNGTTFGGANVPGDLQTIKAQAVTAAAGVTFPTSLASPTNITAGTITTVGALATGAIAATSFASGAINATAFNQSAADKVWGTATRFLTGGTNIALTKGTGLVGLNDITTASVWDLATSGHTTSGTFGAAMNAAGSAGDPWATSLPGGYGAGTAGNIVGTQIDAAISSRSTYAGADTSGTTTLLGRLTTTRAGLLDNLDAAISTRSIFAGGAVASVTGAVGSVTGSVASVAGAVGSVTGAVGSVTAPVTTTSNIKKNQALNAFPFTMRDSNNHILTPGFGVTATRSLDGGAFAACAGTPTGVGNGAYKINLAATDTNANTIMLRFTAAGADDTMIGVVTQP